MLYFWYVLAAIIVVAGLVGIVLPMIPGVPLVFIGLLIAAIVGKFSYVSPLTIGLMALIAAMSLLVDYSSGLIGAKYSGASVFGVIGVILGTAIGILYLGPFGIFIGPAVGVLLFELIAKSPVKKSAKVATWTLFSVTVGILINLFLAFLLIAIFLGAIFI